MEARSRKQAVTWYFWLHPGEMIVARELAMKSREQGRLTVQARARANEAYSLILFIIRT